MGKKIKFTDSVSFTPVFDPEVKDFYQDPNQQLTSLRVRVAATHAGKITRNNGFYLPHKMREGAASFTAQYPKPIQVHHDDRQDPVGRVVSARYVDVSQGIMDAWDARKVCDDKRPIDDSTLKDFCAGKLSDEETLTVADTRFIQDESIVDDPDYQGLGYIELIADITDPDAIRKVLDRRYLTGSIGASTDSAVCSICKADWAGEDGPCEHRPGKAYDGKKCVLIAGKLEYEEWSFVNSPADTHSAVIAVDSSGEIVDSIEVDDIMGESEKVTLEVLDHTQDSQQEDQSKEETNMLELKDKKQADQPAPPTDEVKDKDVQPDKDPKATEDKLQVEGPVPPVEAGTDAPPAKPVKDEAQADDVNDKTQDEPVVDDKVDADPEPDPLQAAKDFHGEEFDEIVGEDAWGEKYADMLHQAIAGELKGEDEEDLSDIKEKKLTSKEREKMSASTFCGPDRSYPVPDCSHAKVAMAYAKKYNESSSVIACIRRKAKRLGCPFKSDEKSQDEAGMDSKWQTPEDFDHLSDAALIHMLGSAQEAAKERELHCQPCHEEAAKLQDRVAALEKEVKFLLEDADVLNSQLADLLQANKELKVQKICDYSKLLDAEVKVVKQEDGTEIELKDASNEAVDKMLNDLAGQVDIAEIADKLNSGLSNNPQGTVENPVVTADKHDEEKDSEIKLDRAMLEQIRAQYFALSFKSQVVADKYLADLQARGILPKGEFKIEDKS